MVELNAKTALEGLVPLKIGQAELVQADLGTLTSIAPYKGKAKSLVQALSKAQRLDWPAPNRATGKAGQRVIWFGREMALLAGPAPDATLAAHAALTDQSDAWATAQLSGPSAEDVLARLVPIDLRAAHFKRGHTARTQVGHMNASITRVGADSFLILVFRAMAGTLVHDLKQAMEGVAARR